MTWNYRVVRSRTGMDEDWLSIRTAWYDEGSDTPHSIGDTPMPPMGADIEELCLDIAAMLKAVNKPVLNDEDFGPEKRVKEISC